MVPGWEIGSPRSTRGVRGDNQKIRQGVICSNTAFLNAFPCKKPRCKPCILTLGVLGGSGGALGGPQGVLGASSGGPGGSSGGPWRSSGASRGAPGGSSGGPREVPKTEKVFVGVSGGGPGGLWGDFGRLEWSLGPTRQVQMLIFCWF